MNDKSLASLDWSLIQSFISVAETGSLTAAAKALQQSQPTVGRHISQIEQALNVVVFSRVHRGVELTAEGRALLPAALDMQSAAARFSLAAAGQVQGLSGVVRITASVFVSHYILPSILAKFRNEEPDIEIELHASDSTENLLFHEADVALRMYRPEQLDTITRHICDFEVGLYAAKSYLARRGVPQSEDELLAHDWVGYDRNDLIIKGMRAVGWHVDRQFFQTRCDNQSAYWQLVASGCGLGVALKVVAENFESVQELVPDVLVPSLPVWLTAPEALRKSPRIRRVFDFLAEELRNVADA